MDTVQVHTWDSQRIATNCISQVYYKGEIHKLLYCFSSIRGMHTA